MVIKNTIIIKITLFTIAFLLIFIAAIDNSNAKTTTTDKGTTVVETDDETLIFKDGSTVSSKEYGKGNLIENNFQFRDDEENGKQAFRYLNKNYPGVFEKAKKFKGNEIPVHYKQYDSENFRRIYYGSSNDAAKLQTNGTVGGDRRYIGVEHTMLSATHNPAVNYDICTDGTLRTRNVIDRPTFNNDLLNTKSNRIDPGTKEFNRSDDIELYYTKLANEAPNTKSTKLKQLADSSGTEIRKTWAKMLDDKYKYDDMIRMNKKHSTCYKRDRYSDIHSNHIATEFPNLIDRIDHFHVTVPPTELTDGNAYEWHMGGRFYDEFYITTRGGNFKATKLRVTHIGTIIEAKLTVQNASGYAIDTKVGIPSQFKLTLPDGTTYVADAPQLIGPWDNNESKTVTLFSNVKIPDQFINKTLSVYGEFNPYKGEDYYESTYDDNSITTKVKIGVDTITNDFNGTCMKSYISAKSETYGISQYDEDGDFLRCDYYNIYLNSAISVGTQSAKHTTLTGLWSSNSRGHYKYKDEIEDKDVGETNTLRATGTPQFSGRNVINTKVTTHKVPGINKLGRVIRAGRNIEMYSGISLIITTQSFNSEATAKSNIDKMYNYMLGRTNKNKFVTRGNRVVGDTVKGTLKNNLGKEETPAQIDAHRKKETVSTTSSTTSYGDSRCGKIYVYTATKEFFVPLATKNAGGKQVTREGDYAPIKEYSVGSNPYRLYTSIDSPDGMYNLFFRNYIDPTIFEGVNQKEDYCDTTPEKFVIQGNLYDDVRTEDKTDSNTLKDLGW